MTGTVKQLILPANRAFDSSGVPSVGATASLFYSGTLTPALFYSDSGLTTSLGSTITANSAGRFTPMPYQDSTVAFRIQIKDEEGNILDDIDPFFFGYQTGSTGPQGAQGPAGDVAKVTTRTALAAITGQTAGFTRYLTESGREGTFVWNSSNLSTLVTADTAQGIYVAPASDTTGVSGAWVRKFSGPVLPTWFGCVADDDDGSTGTNNATAWAAMEAVVVARSKVGSVSAIYSGAIDEILVVGRFYLGAHTIEPLTTIKMRGIGGLGWGCPSRLRFAANTTALRAQSYNTSGDTGITTNHTSGDNWVIEDIYFLGGSDGSTATEGSYHGCHVKRPINLARCTFDNFQGDGLYGDSTGTGGLADVGRVYDCVFTNCRNGRYMTGGDSNAWTFIGCQYTNNRKWGVADYSFLGNYEFGAHSTSNGITGTLTTYTLVSYSGHRYSVVDGQEAGASTNAPSGTTADNTYWYYCYDGTSVTNIPTWTSGISVRSGGAYLANNNNANNSFVGCYSESGQGVSQYSYPTIVEGGTQAAGIRGYAANFYNYQGWARFGSSITNRGAIIDGASTVNGNLAVDGGTGSGTLTIQGSGASPGLYLNESGTTYGYFICAGSTAYVNGSNSLNLRAGGTDIGIVTSSAIDLQTGKALSYAGTTVLNSGVLTAAASPAYTGDVTKPSGSLATTIANNVVTYAKFQQVAASSLVGNPTGSLANAQGITLAGGLAFSGTTLTAAGALTPTSVVSSGAITSSSATAGVGYSTGAGGTVTQLTSRTTGVTINKPCGAITLVSAAGSATWATFTVTNSTVAATDTIEVVQKSGANLYSVIVTAVAAGSFNISVSAVSGTATEAPVLNFNVTKAVTA